MELDRITNTSGKGKYALINLRKIEGNPQTAEELAAAILKHPECVEFGIEGQSDEFFVIKLKDEYARCALLSYSTAARFDNVTYANQVGDLAARSSENNPFCKKPD